MEKILISGILWGFFVPFAFSQNGEHINGGHFEKKIEYNVQSQYSQDSRINSRGDIEKLFFGNINSPVEFFYLPSSEASSDEETYSGFRTVEGISDASYILEVKYISNYKEAQEEANKKYPTISIPLSQWRSTTKEKHKQIKEHNDAAWAKQYEESLRLYRVEFLSFPVSNQFVDKLYKKMVSFIDNFKAKGIPPVIFDGYSVTFRTVVDDEAWSLWIHMPQGDALKMAELCRQIIKDAKAGKLDEKKYISVLNTFESQ